MVQTKDSSLWQSLLKELGLLSLYSAPRDAKLLCIQRLVRGVAFGATAIVLVLYLSGLGYAGTKIGMFMSVTLLGDMVLSFILTLIADAVGRRNILIIGSSLMIASGAVFALTENFWILLVVSVLGVLSPSGNEIGPFRAIEESTLAHLTTIQQRTDTFAWYTLLGTLGTAIGPIACGWATQALQQRHGLTKTNSYKAAFIGYAVLGLIKLLLTLMLSDACEGETLLRGKTPDTPAVRERPEETLRASNHEEVASETDPLLGLPSSNANIHNDVSRSTVESDSHVSSKKPDQRSVPIFARLFPKIAPRSRPTVLKLALLFLLDSLGSGLVVVSWISNYFDRKFALPSGLLGTIFFVAAIGGTISHLIAASIARRLGLVATMVCTHLPSAFFLAAIPFPNSLPVAATFLTIRSLIANMDTAPRQAFVAQSILPEERTAVMGMLNVVRTFAQATGAAITGALASNASDADGAVAKYYWLAFVIGGACKGTYDIGILVSFWGADKPNAADKSSPRVIDDESGAPANSGAEANEP